MRRAENKEAARDEPERQRERAVRASEARAARSAARGAADRYLPPTCFCDARWLMMLIYARPRAPLAAAHAERLHIEDAATPR